MISYIKGRVISSTVEDRYRNVDIVVDNGVGYRVVTPSSVKISKGSCELYTSMQVREDSQSLYGFSSADDRDFFELLLSVSGVGPKLAMSILTIYPVTTVQALILTKDSENLSKVPGLGKKGSQKIILELESRLSELGIKASGEIGLIDNSVIKELKNALKTLGFSGDNLKEYAELGEKRLKENPALTVEELIKSVLQSE